MSRDLKWDSDGVIIEDAVSFAPTSLEEQWLEAKEVEIAAQTRRREIEDELLTSLKIDPNIESTVRVGSLTITSRHTQKVDVNKVQELARDAGVTEHLGSLFRWKAEIDAKNWKKASAEITGHLLSAITTKPGRPSFSAKKEK